MGVTIVELHSKLIPQFVKSNGALNVPLLKTNDQLYNDLLAFSKEIGFANKLGIAFQHVKRQELLRPVCYCGNVTAWSSSISWYKEFCSTKCSANSDNKKTKIRSTCIEKYGVSNPAKIPAVRKKAQQTMQELYGYEHAVHVEQFRNKQHATAVAKYGTTSPLKNKEVRQKIKSTMLSKYGTENCMQSSLVQQKVRDTNNSRYGGPSPCASISTLVKIKELSLLKHGIVDESRIDIFKDSIEKLQSPQWLKNENESKPVFQIASELNVATSVVYNYFKKHNLEFKKHPGSAFESSVLQFVQSVYNGTDITTNTRNIIHPGELDIYIPSHNLAIECNGSYWHSELNGKDRYYHLNKTRECAKQGITLVHVWQHEWEENRMLIESRLASLLGVNNRLFARKLTIGYVDLETTKIFLNANHIQGYCPSKYNIGLYLGNELMAIMTFGKSRYDRSIEYELLRYCSRQGYNIIGGASRLFAKFVNEYSPSSVISYADKMRNTGKLYEKLGFVYSHTSNPAYYYTKDYISFENRVKYQKHKLESLLDKFDSTLTEWENMKANGYDRIWDCGNTVWIYRRNQC